MRYALVGGLKKEPFPGGLGQCPLCGLEVQFQQDPTGIRHWTHVSAEECDLWSEPLTPWHASWQNFADPSLTEVSKKGRRADLVGRKGFVIELQQGPISAEEVKAREAFYGNMVWVFDARCFAAVRTGTTAFFSYGADTYPAACSSLVFLDFGSFLVQVKRHTETFALCSGFGLVRSHKWFAKQLLWGDVFETKVLPSGALPTRSGHPWKTERPYWTTRRSAEWFMNGRVTAVPKGEPFIILNYSCPASDGFVWQDVIAKFPELANGWDLAALERMRQFLDADVAILRGGLRLLPGKVEEISYSPVSKAQTRLLLVELEAHIAAGRIPVLEESSKDHLLRIARSVFRT